MEHLRPGNRSVGMKITVSRLARPVAVGRDQQTLGQVGFRMLGRVVAEPEVKR